MYVAGAEGKGGERACMSREECHWGACQGRGERGREERGEEVEEGRAERGEEEGRAAFLCFSSAGEVTLIPPLVHPRSTPPPVADAFFFAAASSSSFFFFTAPFSSAFFAA